MATSFQIRSARVAEFVTGLVTLFFASAFPLHNATAAERITQFALLGVGLLALILSFRFDPSRRRWRISALAVCLLTLLWATSRIIAVAFASPAGPALTVVMVIMLTLWMAQAWVATVLYRSTLALAVSSLALDEHRATDHERSR